MVGLAAALVFAHVRSARRDGPAVVRQPDVFLRVHGADRQRVSALVAPVGARGAVAHSRPAAWAAVVLIAGVGLLAAGRAGGIQVFEQVAFLVSLCGLVLLVFGVSYVRVAWASLAYLLLMVPLWDAFTEPLHWPFQQRSAAIGVAVMQAIGIPAYREGTFITLPGLTLEVARACSGVNYLIAVLALGLPLAYLYVRGFWRAALLLVGAVTIAALSNGLRVALIGVLAHYEVGSPLHGPFHVLHGLFVSGIGYVVLFGGVRLLESRDRTTESAPPPVMRRRFAFPRVEAAACVLLFAGLGSGVLAHAPERVPLAEGFETFPISLGGWEAERQPAAAAWPPREMWSGADREIRRRYSSRGTSVDVYVALLRAAAAGQGDRRFEDRGAPSQREGDLGARARWSVVFGQPRQGLRRSARDDLLVRTGRRRGDEPACEAAYPLERPPARPEQRGGRGGLEPAPQRRQRGTRRSDRACLVRARRARPTSPAVARITQTTRPCMNIIECDETHGEAWNAFVDAHA